VSDHITRPNVFKMKTKIFQIELQEDDKQNIGVSFS